ncbi:diaminopropionate ammonia-lyase, partial [Litorisediminicola beolgyonensis]
MKLIRNDLARRDAPWTETQDAILSDRALAEARDVITSWEGYAPTPLVSLPQLALEAGVARIDLKDEGPRFGIGSFKALGAAYAVARVLARAASEASGRRIGADEIAAAA